MYVPCIACDVCALPVPCLDRQTQHACPSVCLSDRTGQACYTCVCVCVTIHPSVSSDWTGPDCHLQPSVASSCPAWPGQCLLLLTGTMSSPAPLSPLTGCERASHRDLLSATNFKARISKCASSNEPQGVDQPAEEVKAASSVRVAGGCRVSPSLYKSDVTPCAQPRAGAVRPKQARSGRKQAATHSRLPRTEATPNHRPAKPFLLVRCC